MLFNPIQWKRTGRNPRIVFSRFSKIPFCGSFEKLSCCLHFFKFLVNIKVNTLYILKKQYNNCSFSWYNLFLPKIFYAAKVYLFIKITKFLLLNNIIFWHMSKFSRIWINKSRNVERWHRKFPVSPHFIYYC